LELLIGFFANTLVLRTEVVGEMSFVQLLARVREAALGAYAHQDVPFEKLVQELQPERDMSRQPLFQVMFVLQNATIPALELPEVRLEVLEVETGTAKFDLTLVGEERESGQIMMTVEYYRDLYTAETIERLLEHYERLLEGIVAEPEKAVGRYDILSAEEREQIVGGWGAARREYERGATLIELVGEAARAHAGRRAVVCEGEGISYAELWERSNRLGRYLQSQGVGAETIVAVMLERSVQTVVALLGVMKAGGVYLPVEPSQPQERIEYMLRDAGVHFLLSQQTLLDRLPPHEARVTCIDSEWDVISREDAADFESGVTPDNAAYVIYTSGSTGQPKGVVVSHYHAVRLFQATESWYNFNENDVWTHFHSYAFDFSVWEIWGALSHGSRLVVVPYWVSRSPETFYELLINEQVTVLGQTPSAFRQLIHVEERIGVSPELALRLIILGGEALELQSLKPWFDRHGDQKPRVVNMHGITETIVHDTYRPVTAADLSAASGSMIGIPIEDLEIYILDRYLQPVPIGVPGEMCVGGAGVARGYLNRPGLTAERFVPNPFNNKPSERMYRSGDLARFVSNGDIEFLGRIDHQVKIRGFRIELGEIEAALDQYPGVRESIVIAREDSPGEKRLVAYLVVSTQSTPSISELHSYMKEKVPEYMVPAAFVILDALPLTSNGKVDRLALPSPTSTPVDGEPYVAPRNEIEELLTEIWQEVLGINPIGIHDDYFTLGGDSIRVIQILYKANAYNLPMTVKDVFQAPTVSKLASRISDNKGGGRESIIPMGLIELPQHVRASLPDDIEDAYPVSRMQELMLYHYVHDTQGMGVYHVQQWFHIQDETLSIEALKQSLRMLVQKYPTLRTVFLNVDGVRLQAVKKTVNFTVAEEDITALTEAQQETYLDAAIRKDRVDLFDINNTDEPLFRFKIFKRSESDIEFLMAVNHAIDDGWGNIEFLKELFQLYQTTKTDGEVVLATAFNSFKEFIAMEQEILASAEAKSFWQDHLKNESHRPLQRIVAADKPADRLNYVLDTELTSALQSLARSRKVSLKTVYLSAYYDLIAQVQGQRTATIGVVSNGRSERLTEPLKSLGMFWNMVPICAPIDSENKFAQLANVQQLLIDIELYSRYPLTQIFEDQGKPELFFASLNFLNFHNAKRAFESSEVKLPSSGAHDKFHYPLNFEVSVNPNTGEVWLRVEYDRSYFSVETIESMTDDYIANLKSLAFTADEAYATAAS
jgi:amino acid adenylation domain-containing protein